MTAAVIFGFDGAVEYFLRKKFDELQISQYKLFIHFGLTSQDTNNATLLYSLKDDINNVYIPLIDNVTRQLYHRAVEWVDIAMLAHGQLKSYTSVKKI